MDGYIQGCRKRQDHHSLEADIAGMLPGPRHLRMFRVGRPFVQTRGCGRRVWNGRPPTVAHFAEDGGTCSSQTDALPPGCEIIIVDVD
jgi:hypothetical protein